MSSNWPSSIASYGEGDVRAEIIDPLLRELGYRAGDLHDVRREVSLSLRYPHAWLGRKSPSKDPLLRGRADYIVSAGGVRNWVIEAKPATEDITEDDVEQAYTYARHPEVRALLFVVSNGREFRVYETDAVPGAPPVLAFAYDELESRIPDLRNLLGPIGIERNFPVLRFPSGARPEVAPGYLSPLRIVGGYVTAKGDTELDSIVLGGAVERHEGGLLAYLDTRSPIPQIQATNDRLGIGRFEASSSDKRLSSDPARPSRFSATETVRIEAGERLFLQPTQQWVVIPQTITVRIATTIDAYIEDGFLVAEYQSLISSLMPSTLITGRARLRVA